MKLFQHWLVVQLITACECEPAATLLGVLRSVTTGAQRKGYELSKTYVAVTINNLKRFSDDHECIKSVNISLLIVKNIGDLDGYAAGRYGSYVVDFEPNHKLTTEASVFDPLRVWWKQPSQLEMSRHRDLMQFKKLMSLTRGRWRMKVTDFYRFRTDTLISITVQLRIGNVSSFLRIQFASGKDDPQKTVQVSNTLLCLSPFKLTQPSLRNSFNIFTPAVWILIVIFLTTLLLIIHLNLRTSLFYLLLSILEHLLNIDTFASIPSRRHWSVVISKIVVLLMIDVFFFAIFKNDFISVLTTPTKIAIHNDLSDSELLAFKSKEYIAYIKHNVHDVLANEPICSATPDSIKKASVYDLMVVGSTNQYYVYRCGSTVLFYSVFRPVHECGLFTLALTANITMHTKSLDLLTVFFEKIEKKVFNFANSLPHFNTNQPFVKKTDDWQDYQGAVIAWTLKICLSFGAFAGFCFVIEVLCTNYNVLLTTLFTFVTPRRQKVKISKTYRDRSFRIVWTNLAEKNVICSRNVGKKVCR